MKATELAKKIKKEIVEDNDRLPVECFINKEGLYLLAKSVLDAEKALTPMGVIKPKDSITGGVVIIRDIEAEKDWLLKYSSEE